jgi:hypothetical protein
VEGFILLALRIRLLCAVLIAQDCNNVHAKLTIVIAKAYEQDRSNDDTTYAISPLCVTEVWVEFVVSRKHVEELSGTRGSLSV